MLEGKTRIRKWGNSFAIRIPKEILKEGGLRLNDKVVFMLNKKITKVEDIFGKLKFKTPTEKLLKKIDEELW